MPPDSPRDSLTVSSRAQYRRAFFAKAEHTDMAVNFISEVKRTHSCGQLTQADVGKQVVLFGWVQNRRDHGGAVFIDLRDREGLTQIVFEPEVSLGAHELAGSLRLEFVIGVRGKVV